MKKGVYQFQGTPAEVIARLETARAEDLKAEKKSLKFGCGAGFFFVAMFISFVGAQDFTPLLVAAFAFLAGFVACLVMLFRSQAHNLEDAQLLAPLRLLSMARADLPPDRPVRLKVDFRDFAARDFQLSSQGSFFGNKNTVYRQPWLEFQGRLADGARLDLEVLRKAERLDYWKTRGGKSKRRSKDKVQDVVTLRLQVPGLDLSGLVPALSPGPPVGLVGKDLKVQGDTVRMELVTPRAQRTSGSRNSRSLEPGDLASGDRLLALLVWLYQGVGRLRAAGVPSVEPGPG